MTLFIVQGNGLTQQVTEHDFFCLQSCQPYGFKDIVLQSYQPYGFKDIVLQSCQPYGFKDILLFIFQCYSSFLQSCQPYGFKDIVLFIFQCYSSFLQSCQPYGFKDIVLFINQYYANKYVDLKHKILTGNCLTVEYCSIDIDLNEEKNFIVLIQLFFHFPVGN